MNPQLEVKKMAHSDNICPRPRNLIQDYLSHGGQQAYRGELPGRAYNILYSAHREDGYFCAHAGCGIWVCSWHSWAGTDHREYCPDHYQQHRST